MTSCTRAALADRDRPELVLVDRAGEDREQPVRAGVGREVPVVGRRPGASRTEPPTTYAAWPCAHSRSITAVTDAGGSTTVRCQAYSRTRSGRSHRTVTHGRQGVELTPAEAREKPRRDSLSVRSGLSPPGAVQGHRYRRLVVHGCRNDGYPDGGVVSRVGGEPLVAAEEQVGPPGLVAVVGEVRREQRVQVASRLERRPEQPDPRLLGRLAALAVVARLAGRDEVVPGVRPAAVARQDVVQRQVVAPRGRSTGRCGGRARRPRAGSA